jgi:5-dehydro-2-deoxygluconokinase
VISSVGDDPFGRFVGKALRGLGVSDAHVVTNPHCATQVSFCEILPPDDLPVWAYGSPPTDDLETTAGDIDLDAVRDAELLWMSASGLYEEADRASHFAALEARARKPFTVLDLDCRPLRSTAPADAPDQLQEALSKVTVAVGSGDSCAFAVAEREPERAADALLTAGVEVAVVKKGREGVLAKTRSGERVESSAVPALRILNRLGASDAFAGSLCHGLLAGWPLAKVMRHAIAAGVIAASRLECSTVMPTELEIETLLDGGDPNSILIDAWAARTASASR